MSKLMISAAAAAMAVIALSADQVAAQAAPETAPASAAAPAPAPTSVLLREGTEVTIQFEQKLSSATAADGDVFNVSLADSVDVEGVRIPQGYSGRGEVVSAEKRGFMGRAGELNVRLNYIRIGDQRVKLRASKGGEGKGAIGATVALTVLFGPLGLLKRGHDLEIPRGQEITAFVDEDAKIALPLASPPNDS